MEKQQSLASPIRPRAESIQELSSEYNAHQATPSQVPLVQVLAAEHFQPYEINSLKKHKKIQLASKANKFKHLFSHRDKFHAANKSSKTSARKSLIPALRFHPIRAHLIDLQ